MIGHAQKQRPTMVLNSRQTEILEKLLGTSSPVSMHALGRELNISRRVVRYNLPMINFWLETHGVQIETRPRVGVQLRVSEATRQQIARELAGSRPRPIFSQEARLNALRFELLTSDTYRNRPDLQEIFSVSSATLSRDLTQSEAWIERNNLHLERRPRRGIRIAGSEADIRHAIVSLLLQLDLSPALLDLCIERTGVATLEHDLRRADQRFALQRAATWSLAAAWQSIIQIELANHIQLADADRLVLAIHWALMTVRIPQDMTLLIPETVQDHIAEMPERVAVARIMKAHASALGLTIPADEIDHFTLLLSTSLREERADATSTDPITTPRDEVLVTSLANRLIGEFSGASLRQDAAREIADQLQDHLLRALIRLRHGLPIRNPLASEVQQAYPAFWHRARSIVASYEERLNVSFPADEIAFLTMYIALVSNLGQVHSRGTPPQVLIVCPTGGITVQMLLHRLREELPDVAIVDVISVRQLSEVDTSKVDAVVSTARLALRDLPVITISPLVTPDDLSVLRRELNLIR